MIPMNIQEASLLRITVIKKKHASQIREQFRERPDWVPSEVELIGSIQEWHALLCRRRDNGHFLVVQVAEYYRAHQKLGSGHRPWSHVQAEIADRIHQLPQIFLD
jgi:hypothetical protein